MNNQNNNLKYYHITEIELIDSILKEGLKANEDGEIFLFENKSIRVNNVVNTVADCIAMNQIFLDEYVMFEIDSKGISLELINDNVGELSHKQQWIAIQPLIEPNYISVFGIYKTGYKNFYPHPE